MNRDWILFHLQEAHEELTRTIHEMEQDPEYDFGEYVVAMTHLYHHLNTAWNSRDASPERVKACSEEDFEKWRQFPSDVDMSVI
jgi:hypothetical protein